MKTYATLFTLLLVAFSSWAQSLFNGTWEGKMKAGADVRMIFHISQDPTGAYTLALDCPDQGLKGMQVNSLSVIKDSLRFEITRFGASYAGKLGNDSLISGTFKQGLSFQLNLKKVKILTTRIRPQTPVAPFPYKSEDIVYTNKDKSINYGATITVPPGKGPFPCLLLITGSGPQNRDEEILDHKPFAVIADHLTRDGFIVLRVDDRGVGKTTGDIATVTTRDFANDASAGLDYLLGRTEVDRRRIGLLGHSEGGMIAQILAAERKDISFVVLLAGPGEKTTMVMKQQNEVALTKAGLPKIVVDQYLELYENLMKVTISSDRDQLRQGISAQVASWVQKTSPDVVKMTTGISDSVTQEKFINQSAAQLGHPWFKYFLSYDPAPVIQKISARVLALNGSEDVQVISKSNLEAIEIALKGSKSKSYEVKELKGLNHLFQECKTCILSEYGQLDQTISPPVLQLISTWLGQK